MLARQPAYLNGLDHRLEHVKDGLVCDVVLAHLLHMLLEQVLTEEATSLHHSCSLKAHFGKFELHIGSAGVARGTSRLCCTFIWPEALF